MVGFVKYYEILLQKAVVDMRSARLLYSNFHKIPLQINSKRLIDLSDFVVEGRYSIIHDDLVDAEQYFEEISHLYQQVKELIITRQD